MAAGLRFLILCFLFCAEVRVHASTWLSEPVGCQLLEKGCVMRAERTKSQIQPLRIVAREDSILLSRGEFVIQLVRGSMLVKLGTIRQILTPMAKVEGDGEVILERFEDKLKITCVNGEVKIWPTGAKDSQSLISGFWTEVGEVRREGGMTEIPQVAAVGPTLRLWWNHYLGTMDEFRAEVKDFASAAGSRAEAMGEFQKNMVARAIASQIETERLRQERARKEAEEAGRMRALFRKENYISN